MAKIKDNTADVLREADKLISQKLKTSALIVERRAKQILVPGYGLISGTLKRSITHKPAVPKRVVYVGTNLEYARRQELGFTGKDKLGRYYHQSAKPYLRPALEASIPEIRRLFTTK